jgi:hypothetical protein
MAASGKAQRVEIRQWEHLGGNFFYQPSNQELILPAGTTVVSLEVETGSCYYAVNQSGAAGNSHGYVSADGFRAIGPLINLTSFHIHGPSASVHVQYYREG